MGTTVIPAVWDLPSALAARAAGAERLFLSGAALAAELGLPDLGMVSATELVDAARRIVDATRLPLLVDAETGYGPLPALARLAESLLGAGVEGLMLEDQEYTGQSVGARPELCAPEVMAARVELVVSAGLRVLARTDVLDGDWPFDESLRRLERYLEAGADWALPVFVRSPQELERAAALAPGRAFGLAVEGAGGYVPTLDDAATAGMGALIVIGQHRAVFPRLLELYELTMRGAARELLAARMDGARFAELTGAERWTARP